MPLPGKFSIVWIAYHAYLVKYADLYTGNYIYIYIKLVKLIRVPPVKVKISFPPEKKNKYDSELLRKILYRMNNPNMHIYSKMCI